MTRTDWPQPFDPYCLRHPTEIPEYQAAAAEQGCSPDDYVRYAEGTYNRATGHFACTDCYLAIGAPTSETGWTAP